ncbi:MAG TPA: molybdate ABC transporter substrate-binding protein [Myxococcota bacterium]|nr:molybdate ABC transporter substrate-binding protein [Myxococcota bacterium]
MQKLAIVALAFVLAACSQEKVELRSQPEPAQAAQAPSVLRVAAAASLREAAQEIGARFGAAEPAIRVELSFGASSELAAQLRAGAPVDVLLSADEEIPRALEAEGLGTELRPFAGNRLVVIASVAAADRVEQASDLTGDAVKHIAMPGPAVPIGHYAREWLTKVGLLQAVEPRIVQTENVRATLAAVDAGNADAAIVYATDARVAASARVAFEIPESEQPRIVYVALRASATKQPDTARRFLAFLGSNESASILQDSGFPPPGASPAP